MKKNHNYGLCRKCGKEHIHPKGMLGKSNKGHGCGRPKGYKCKKGLNVGSKNGMFGKSRNKDKFYNINPNIYIVEIKCMIEDAFTTKQMSKEIGLSVWYIKRIIKKYLPQLFETSKSINKKGKGHKGLKHKYPNPNKGKTYEEIMGIEKATKKRKKMSDWMSTGKNIIHTLNSIAKMSKSKIEFYRLHPEKHANRILAERKKNGNYKSKGQPSMPQLELFELVKQYYPNEIVELEYPIYMGKGTFFLDIAIPSLKLNFEFDGSYWHKDVEKDIERNKKLELFGWKVRRFDKVPKDLSICL